MFPSTVALCVSAVCSFYCRAFACRISFYCYYACLSCFILLSHLEFLQLVALTVKLFAYHVAFFCHTCCFHVFLYFHTFCFCSFPLLLSRCLLIMFPFAVGLFAYHVSFYCHAVCFAACSFHWHTCSLSCFLLLSCSLLNMFSLLSRFVFLLLVPFTVTMFACHFTLYLLAFCLSCFL